MTEVRYLAYGIRSSLGEEGQSCQKSPVSPTAARSCLQLVDRLGLEWFGQAIAVPALGECPHVIKRDAFADVGPGFLRPKERDGASSSNDVVPPVTGSDAKVDISDCRDENAVADIQQERLIGVTPGRIDPCVLLDGCNDS